MITLNGNPASIMLDQKKIACDKGKGERFLETWGPSQGTTPFNRKYIVF
jgi:hypothetical protein